MVDNTAHESDVVPELAELNRYRLDRDMTYERLAEDMSTRLNVQIPWRTLHAALTTNAKPYDRTLHKIRRYLELVRAEAS